MSIRTPMNAPATTTWMYGNVKKDRLHQIAVNDLMKARAFIKFFQFLRGHLGDRDLY